jgi:hypothetical protein
MSRIQQDETKQMDSKARAAAKRVGLRARKSRQSIHLDNLGGYMLINPYFNTVVVGVRFDMSAQDVIEYCDEQRLKDRSE